MEQPRSNHLDGGEIFNPTFKTNYTMLIVYIALGAFILGGVIFLALGFNPQRNSRKWY